MYSGFCSQEAKVAGTNLEFVEEDIVELDSLLEDSDTVELAEVV